MKEFPSPTDETKEIPELRDQVTKLDHRLIADIASRISVARLIIKRKADLALEPFDQEREDFLLSRYMELAVQLDLSPEFVAAVFKLIFEEAKVGSRKNDLISR
jgi:chorismate mutase